MCCCTGCSCRRGRRPDVGLLHCTTNGYAGCASLTFRSFIRGILQVALTASIALVVIVWLGAEYEDWNVRRTPKTLGFYNQQTHVCGMIVVPKPGTHHNSKVSGSMDNVLTMNSTSTAGTHSASSDSFDADKFELRIESFASIAEEEAVATSVLEERGMLNISSSVNGTDDNSTSVIVAHCGDCGACSTPHDINLYDETRNTLLKSTTQCAKRALIWGRATAETCMEKSVGFTAECNDCWIENIMCDLRKCVFTCMWYGLFKTIDDSAPATSTDGTTTPSKNALNPCTACDEQRCGPAFVKCAGANRRRSGIVSDIQRDPDSEVCHSIRPPAWWTDPQLHQLAIQT
jgi:hypothetical protein